MAIVSPAPRHNSQMYPIDSHEPEYNEGSPACRTRPLAWSSSYRNNSGSSLMSGMRLTAPPRQGESLQAICPRPLSNPSTPRLQTANSLAYEGIRSRWSVRGFHSMTILQFMWVSLTRFKEVALQPTLRHPDQEHVVLLACESVRYWSTSAWSSRGFHSISVLQFRQLSTPKKASWSTETVVACSRLAQRHHTHNNTSIFQYYFYPNDFCSDSVLKMMYYTLPYDGIKNRHWHTMMIHFFQLAPKCCWCRPHAKLVRSDVSPFLVQPTNVLDYDIFPIWCHYSNVWVLLRTQAQPTNGFAEASSERISWC